MDKYRKFILVFSIGYLGLLALLGVEFNYPYWAEKFGWPSMSGALILWFAALGLIVLFAVWFFMLFFDHKRDTALITNLRAQLTPTLEERVRDWLLDATFSVAKARTTDTHFTLHCTLSNGRIINILHSPQRERFLLYFVGLALVGNDIKKFIDLKPDRRRAFIHALGDEAARSGGAYNVYEGEGAIVTIEKRNEISSLTESIVLETIDSMSSVANLLDSKASSELNRLFSEQRSAAP